ncbi:chemotaxis protein CheB [Dyella sp. A6]|uniref:chemotaxis protein CheB n=1 Tax=Dyella aluminiiresistens TaxID=3069105 RepID=UPI002E79FB6C|nr:chemotaxis protein CheB [Dyella sp. A6]
MNGNAVTAVALLFDDAELGGQLKAALDECGARIVHEGGLADMDRQRLVASGAHVLVVNLDDDADEAVLDRLYGMIDGDGPRVVFNDAQACRGLDGWSRARWARHLAVKVLAAGDVDPPRPADARAPDAHAGAGAGDRPSAVGDTPDDAALSPPSDPELHQDIDEQQAAAESASLAAELEELLAHDEPAEPAFAEGEGGLKFDADAELPPLFDGDFGAMETTADKPAEASEPSELHQEFSAYMAGLDEMEPVASVAAEAKPEATPSIRTDHLSLAADDDESPLQSSTVERSAVEPPSAPEWGFLEDDDMLSPPVAAPAAEHKPSDFGIEKLSAADFLAPDSADEGASPIEPGLSLELMSMEDAVAPTEYVPNEFVLGDLDSALSRLVVLGATTESTDSVCRFLAGLPLGLKSAVLLTQHLAGTSADGLVEYISGHSTLPVRMAQTGARARAGEVWVVPSGQQVRIARSGAMELLAADEQAAYSPSIDTSFTMAATTFGQSVVAIVFAGRSTDAVGGCQAIHDRGGKVWVEVSSGEHFADMVSGVMAEHLSQFSGTPQELAARLTEEFQTEGRS